MESAQTTHMKSRPFSTTCLLLILFVLTCVSPSALHADNHVIHPQENTLNVPQTYQRAMNGDVDAQFALFMAYRRGTGVDSNIDKAKRWLLSAAQNGHAEAQYWLGYIHFFGKGVERDVEAGMKWYKKSAAQGSIHAQVALGEIYNGWRYRFYPSDPSQAIAWYTKAAEQGHLQSIFIVGCKHYFGIQQLINIQEGLSWFQKAAERGDDTAMAYLKMDNNGDLNLFCRTIARL